MAKRLPAAKRARRANPRMDRNNHDNILDFASYEPNTKRSKNRVRHTQHSQDSENNFTSIRKKIDLVPRNYAQEEYIDALNDDTKTVVIAVGPAGTGKTFLAVLKCIKDLNEGNIEKIVVIRPVVTADGSNLGALPGNIIDKLGPYVGEVMSIFKEYLGVKTVLKMLENEIIEILPIALARGRSLKKCGIIIEEGQNIDEHATKLLFTRISTGSRMYLNGDIRQADRGFEANNGLKDFLQRLKNKGGSSHFAVCSFGINDVERHPVVEETLRLYDQED